MLNYSATLTFIYLRPVFGAFIIILLILMALVIIQGASKRFFNLFSFFYVLLICLLIPAMLLYASGYIVDEYGLGGDPATFNMLLIIVGLCVSNVITYMFVYTRKLRNH